MQIEGEQRKRGGAADFLRLWLVLGFAYAMTKLAVDLAVGGFVDLRTVALWGLLLVPLGQAVVVHVIRRRAG